MIKQKILIVEDDEISAGILSDYLKLHHFEVDLAHNGRDGLALYKQNSYVLIITDIFMPEMTGVELIQKIRDIDGNIPIIVQSSNKAPEEIIEIMKYGVYDYFLKPFKQTELLRKIANAIESSIVEKASRDQKDVRIQQIETEIDWYRYKERNKSTDNNHSKRFLHKKLFENLYRIFIQGAGIGAISSLIDILNSMPEDENGNKLLDSDLLNMLITNNEVVKRSFNQINKINMMIDSQVEITKISAFEAASLFLEIRENFRDLAKLKNQDLFISTPSSDFKNKFIMVSKELLKEAYEELITNAFKFSEENSFITVLFYIQNQSFTTSVINKPFHVEKEKSFTLEQYNLVFEPFFRNYNFVDERYNTLDYGLGLTMVDIIAEKMNGRIHITKLKDHTFVSKSKQSEEKIEFILDLPIVS